MLDADTLAAQLNPQFQWSVLHGTADGYDGDNAAQPHNVRFALWRLGIWTEKGEPTALGIAVRTILAGDPA
jgi:hypothetical protein